MQNENTVAAEVATAEPSSEAARTETFPDQASAESHENADGGSPVSLRRRLQAWWEGTDPISPEEVRKPGVAEPPATIAPEATRSNPISAEARAEIDAAAWSQDRIDASELAWGEGHTGPGDEAFREDTMQRLKPEPSMRMLDLSAALGTDARSIIETFGVWVACLDPSPKLAEKGSEDSAAAGMSDVAPVSHYDPENVQLPADSYDCVIAREVLYTTKNKERLFETIVAALKSRGELVITDYMLSEPRADGDELRDWIASEPLRPHLWSVAEYTDVLRQLKLDVYLKDDLTDRFRGLIVEGLEKLIAKCADHEKLDKQSGEALLHEAELWAGRKAVLDSGLVQVVRIYARKTEIEKGPMRTMGDW